MHQTDFAEYFPPKSPLYRRLLFSRFEGADIPEDFSHQLRVDPTSERNFLKYRLLFLSSNKHLVKMPNHPQSVLPLF